MSQQRKQWADKGEEIMRILKRHLVGREDISKSCAEEKLQPTQFYRWQAQLFAGGAAVFARKNGSGERRARLESLDKIAQLEEKLQKKNEVMAELMEALTEEKKRNGES